MKPPEDSLDALHERVTAMCCKLYSIKSPAECRRMQDAGEISANDFFASLELAIIDSPITWVAQRAVFLDWLFPETDSDRQRALNAKFEAILLSDIPAEPGHEEKLAKMKAALIQERVTNGR